LRSAVSLVANRVTGGKQTRQNMPTLEGVGMAPENLFGNRHPTE